MITVSVPLTSVQPPLSDGLTCAVPGKDQIGGEGLTVLPPAGVSLGHTNLGSRSLQPWTSNFLPLSLGFLTYKMRIKKPHYHDR